MTVSRRRASIRDQRNRAVRGGLGERGSRQRRGNRRRRSRFSARSTRSTKASAPRSAVQPRERPPAEIEGDLQENRKRSGSRARSRSPEVARRASLPHTSTRDSSTLSLLARRASRDLLNRVRDGQLDLERDATSSAGSSSGPRPTESHPAHDAEQQRSSLKAAQRQHRVSARSASTSHRPSAARFSGSRRPRLHSGSSRPHEHCLPGSRLRRSAASGSVPRRPKAPRSRRERPQSRGVAMRYLGVPYVWGGSAHGASTARAW